MIECVLVSGLLCAACQAPLAGMVICGSDPNLRCEREALAFFLVFPIPIFSIGLPVRFLAFLTTRATGAFPGAV
ncbi:hypothetical protein CCR78_06145 [Rhodovulum imhoffii]|nr:hypothetical protein [Rhodovulum imhoffii]